MTTPRSCRETYFAGQPKAESEIVPVIVTVGGFMLSVTSAGESARGMPPGDGFMPQNRNIWMSCMASLAEAWFQPIFVNQLTDSES